MSAQEFIVPLLDSAGQKVTAHYMGHKAARQFTADIKEFMTYFIQYGYVEPVLPQYSQPYSPIGWRTNPAKSVKIFYHMYPDIEAAIDQNGFTDAIVAAAGLDRPVTFNLNSVSKDASVRQRLGRGWSSRIRKKLLQDSDTNPFYDSSRIQSRKDIGKHCAGIMSKSARAQGFAGAAILRVLCLARVCGVYELTMADLLDIMAHASLYEQLARNYISSLLGLTGFNLTRYGYRLPNGHSLGMRKNDMIPSEGVAGYFIHVGTIFHGRPILSYPARAEDLHDVEIKLGKDTSVMENEPILMDSAIATALFYRPSNKRKRTMTKDLTVGVLRDVSYGLMPNYVVSKIEGARQRAVKEDVHGNPLWQSQDAEPIKVRVIRHSGSKKLVAWIGTIGDYHWDWPPAGVFGKPCSCKKADPDKRVMEKRFRGIPTTEVFCHSLATQEQVDVGYDSLQFHWVTGDLPLAMQKTGGHMVNSYVQVRGECLYCAANNAAAYGCGMVIAGGI